MTTPTPGDRLVLFGITGDLVKKLVMPALYRLAVQKKLDIPITGVALTDWDLAALRQHAHDDIVAAEGGIDENVFAELSERLTLVAGDYSDPATFQRLKDEVGTGGFLVHYLAIPPSLFATAAAGIASVGLNTNARLVVEKPFGHDLASAKALGDELHRYFPEERLFRVDHYLGKEPVEDLVVLRFANTMLDPIWSWHFVNRVQITMSETLDVADRGSFYDGVGTIRDVIQNHLLQIFAYLAMEAPVSSDAERQRDEKVKLLRATRTADPAEMVRGQYDGYLDTKGVRPGSTTETYAAITLHVDNWRWSGVPFLLRAGKALADPVLEIVLELRNTPKQLFPGPDGGQAPPNLIRYRLQPEPSLTVEILAKQPGSDRTRPVHVDVDFTRALGSMAEAYETVLSDALAGDTHHFARQDTVEEAWRIVGSLIDRADAPKPYQRGSWGPAEADRLPADGSWIPPRLGDVDAEG